MPLLPEAVLDAAALPAASNAEGGKEEALVGVEKGVGGGAEGEAEERGCEAADRGDGERELVGTVFRRP